MKCSTCGTMNCMQHGGEIESPEMEGHEEMGHALSGELMDSLERKDKKEIFEAMHALVMHCGGKV